MHQKGRDPSLTCCEAPSAPQTPSLDLGRDPRATEGTQRKRGREGGKRGNQRRERREKEKGKKGGERVSYW